MAKNEIKINSGISEIPKSHLTSVKNAHIELIGNPEQFQFTKGDWVAERKSDNQICHLIKTGDKYTIHLYDSKYGIDTDESWANAVLVSKAPQLLNMLIAILKHIKDDELEEISHFPMLIEANNLIQELKFINK
jgi:hypothetical protein